MKPNEELRIFHLPRCSKSRQALALLQERGLEPEVVEYLEHPPTAAEFLELARLLGRPPHELLRTKESAYGEAGLGPESTAGEIAEAVAAHPILLERPIVVLGARAVIGRPPELVLELLED